MRRTIWCRGLAGILLVFAMQGAAGAQSTAGFDGEWALRLGRRTLFVLTVGPAEGKGQAVSGTLARPTHMSTKDMVSFSGVEGPTVVEPIVGSGWKGSSLSITVRGATEETTYALSRKDAGHVELQMVGVPFPAMELVRVQGPVAVSEDWEAGKTYSVEDDAASNPEMKRMFEEDQRVRAVGSAKMDWVAVGKSDAERREATRKLLDAGALHSGEDYYWAATVFQHGDVSNDYLLAHTLAMVGGRRGFSDAIWIAAATLDRYLQSVKQPQIYGTQFLTPEGKAATQEPYDRTLIPDALRKDLDVPGLAAQEEQRKQYDAAEKAH